MIKIILSCFLLGLLGSCAYSDKSEEAIILKIDTKSILKNREITSHIHIKNGKDVSSL